MTNPLFDTLFGQHRTSEAVFLYLQEGHSLSYRAFLDMAAQYAGAISAMGLVAGDRVAVQTAKSPQTLAVYAACVQAGFVFLPLNTAYTPDEVSYFVENSGARLVLGDDSRRDALASLAARCNARLETLNADGSGTFPAQAATCPKTFETISRSESDLAAFLYTSGTTGRSKGAMLSQGNLAFERTRSARRMAVYIAGYPVARAADLPHSWAVCCDKHHPFVWRPDDFLAEI